MLRVLQLGDNDYLSISSSGWSSGPTVPRDPTVGSGSIQHRNMRPVIDVTSLQVAIFAVYSERGSSITGYVRMSQIDMEK